VIVRWDGDNRVCTADFALTSAGEIEPGLWSEGVTLAINSRTGRVIEETAYER
jgi:hypothetical protein